MPIRDCKPGSRCFSFRQGFQLKNNSEPPKLQALLALEASGIAQQSVRESWTEWRMTALGQRRLRTSQVASKSEPALARAAADVPLEDKSVFQLLCDLQADKWMLCVHDPKTRKHPKPSSVAASSSQVPAPHQARAIKILVAERGQ